MRVTLISDQHGVLPEVPKCDLLLIAGDVSPLAFDRETVKVREWLHKEYREWLEKAPAKKIVGIAGNHDFAFTEFGIPDLPWTYLMDHSATYEGYKIWGTPWVPNLAGWAFSGWGEDACVRPFENIPDNIDILMSHGPPRGIGDKINSHGHIGSTSLLEAVERVKPKVHVFGHIHEAHGEFEAEGIRFYNGAIVDEFYEHNRDPWVFDL